MTQVAQLITITDDYLPLAGLGTNTIRQYKGKYLGLCPGDHVTMFHTAEVNTKEIIPQTIEMMRVSAVVIGTLQTICTHHGPTNHAFDEISKFQAHILQFYYSPEEIAAGDIAPNVQYCAIYF